MDKVSLIRSPWIANGIVVVLTRRLLFNKYFDCLAGLWWRPRWEGARIRENNYILHKIASILFSLPTSSGDRALGYFPNWSAILQLSAFAKGPREACLGVAA